MTTQDMIQSVNRYLDNSGIRYEYDAANDTVRFGTKVDCRLSSVRYRIGFGDEDYTVYVTCQMNAAESARDEIAKYLTMANYGLRSGNFEMDYRDGEIRYKVYVDCHDLDWLPDKIIGRSIFVPLGMVERYGDGIAALLMGFSSAEDEIRKAEKDMD